MHPYGMTLLFGDASGTAPAALKAHMLAVEQARETNGCKQARKPSARCSMRCSTSSRLRAISRQAELEFNDTRG
jgi:hypothetical protein